MGRLATRIATLLIGKNKPDYVSHLDVGDWVVVINASKINVSGRKSEQKKYYRHTTQIGHLKERTLEQLWQKKGPAEILRRTVMGMLPKNKLRIKRIKKLIIE